MSLQFTQTEDRVDSLTLNDVDGLIANYFDQAFLFFNVFEDDPRICLDRCEGVFRTLDAHSGGTDAAYYRQLVEQVRGLPHGNEAHPGLPKDSILCWLLKDSAALSYAEIGALMHMERTQVQQRIADVRTSLLG